MDNKRSIEKHYGRGGIRDAILNALSRAGKDLTRLSPIDLAPVDEFAICYNQNHKKAVGV